MGTDTTRAESRSVTTVSVDAEGGRFDAVKREFDQAVQARVSAGYWEDRAVESSFSGQFLAVSWRGSAKYWKAIAWQKKRKAFASAREALAHGARFGRGKRPERTRDLEAAGRELRDRFATKRDGPYALEVFVFFKTSNIAPPALVQMAPTCVQGFIEAPLHTYFLIARHQAPVDRGEAFRFSHFETDRETPRTAADLQACLLKKIFPKEPPVTDVDPPPRCSWCLVLGGLALFLLAAAGSVLAVPAWRDAAFEALDIGRQSDVTRLDRDVERLLEQYTQLLARIDARPVDADPARIARIEQDLSILADRLASHGHSVPERSVPLGYAPCLPVIPTASSAGGAPGYLFAVTLGVDGITINEPSGIHALSAADRSDPDFPPMGALPTAPLTLSGFEALAAPISERARSAGCMHYVLLREGEGSERNRYMQQRNAVERHFYIYRPHP